MEAYHNEVRGWLSRNDKCFLIRIPTVLLKLHILSLHGIKKKDEDVIIETARQDLI